MATRKNKNQSKPSDSAQNWAMVGFRAATIVAVSALLYLPAMRPYPNLNTLVIAGMVAAVMTLVLAMIALVEQTKPYVAWGMLFGDWLIVGFYAPLVSPHPELMLLLVVGLGLTTSLQAGVGWGATSVSVSLGILLGVFGFINDFNANAINGFLLNLLIPASASLLFVLTAGVMTQERERQLVEDHAAMEKGIETAKERVSQSQQRARMITDMAQTLSSTLNYRRVLEMALKVGRMGLADINSNFMGLVLLYSPEDQNLYVATGRGMARGDETRIIQGRTGIVGEALTLCEPVFGGAARKDPELRHFRGMNPIRSTMVVPLRAGYDNYGVLVFGSRENDAFDEHNSSFMEAIGIQTTIALQNAALYQDVAEEKERIVEVEEEARKKLARDLHDGPTQTISAIAMRMAIIQKMMERMPEEVPKELEKIEQLARQTTTEIRHMLFTLRPLALESQGLTAALEQLAEKFDAVYDQKVDVVVSPRAEDLMTPHQSGTIFYIIEEAVNNARKHAEAPVIRVRVSTYEDVILVEIADDGRGFDVESVTGNYEGRGSLGMVNLRDRADLIDGTLTIDSAPGRGTTISVVVPLDPTGNNEKFAAEEAKRRKGFQLHAIR